MERVADKALVLIACLALLGAGPGWASPDSAAPVVTGLLVAVACSALAEALPGTAGVVAGAAGSMAALVAPGAAALVPLPCYDAMRALHRAGPVRAALALPPACLIISCSLWSCDPDELALIVATSALATMLGARTNRMLARRETFLRVHDDLVGRARALASKNRALSRELDDARGRLDADAPAADEGARRIPASFSCLTERELEVARLIADGLDNREIAQAAYMGEGTVRNHISSILSKLHLKNRTQIAIAYWRG